MYEEQRDDDDDDIDNECCADNEFDTKDNFCRFSTEIWQII